MLLIWALHNSPSSFTPAPPTLSQSDSLTIEEADGDLLITPELLSSFTADLAHRGITLAFIAGPWSPTLTPQLAPSLEGGSLLILAAETIYSLDSLSDFTTTLIALLQKARLGKALVAAKRIYFGVGGSVDAFKEAVSSRGGVTYEVENSGVEGCDRAMRGSAGGVGRCLMEVQMC